MSLANIFRVPRFTRPPSADLPSAIRSTTAAIVREAEKDRTINLLSNALLQAQAIEALRRREEAANDSELDEMLMMRGSGPWRLPGALTTQRGHQPELLREGSKLLKESTLPYVAQGAYGDAELMLNNIEWKRETSLSWLEFTRWGIQQIILISRLRCTKDPMLQRGMNVSAQYVFGRGVEITSPDETAAAILKDWRERNKAALGHTALAEQERAKFYDGNIFWICFTDKLDSGKVNIRTLDATEMLDVITDPDDSSTPWYYRREWIQQEMDDKGNRRNVAKKAWYPALNYEPSGADKRDQIDGVEVMWDSPVYHRKCGAPGKWHFGLPLVYAALGYAKAVQRFLEDCMTIRNSLAQFSMLLTTKGGQQALQGAKTQLSTTVGPNASLWDQNPPAVTGSIFASGPGTTLQAFSTKGAGGDPGEVREYKLQVAMVFGLPESFFADMNTSNLATATSLDRPTELNFIEKQEVWREDLITLALYQLRMSMGAASGKLREAFKDRKISITEARRFRNARGRMVYEAKKKPDQIEVMVNFPAIIESDVPANVGAIVQAMTLANTQGQVVGIDEREGVRLLNTEFGIGEEILQEQYPDAGNDKYDPLRTKEEEPDPAVDPATGLPAARPSPAPKPAAKKK